MTQLRESGFEDLEYFVLPASTSVPSAEAAQRSRRITLEPFQQNLIRLFSTERTISMDDMLTRFACAKRLVANLCVLCDEGYIETVDGPNSGREEEVSPYAVSYRLTDKGRAVLGQLESCVELGNDLPNSIGS